MSINEPRSTPRGEASARAAASFLLGILGTLTLAIGIAVLFGGAWTAVALGVILLAYSFLLAFPNKSVWG